MKDFIDDLLFDVEEKAIPDVPGLIYLPDFISKEEEQTFIAHIDTQPWLHDLKRRVQHYGYKYDYKARMVTEDSYLGPLPDWVMPLCNRLASDTVFSQDPESPV